MFKITFIFLFAFLLPRGNQSFPPRGCVKIVELVCLGDRWVLQLTFSHRLQSEGHQKFGLYNPKTKKGTNDISGRKRLLFQRRLHAKTGSMLKNGIKQSYAIPAPGIKYNLNNEHFFAIPVRLNTMNQISESFSNINLNYNVLM